MLLQFPDFETLSLAISSGTIPEEVTIAALDVAVDADDSVWIDASGSLPRSAADTLKSWGVSVRRGKGKLKSQFQSRESWLQVVPLRRDSNLENIGDRTQVIFELHDHDLLPELVNEILRQGNDRQSFRTVGSNGDTRILLRVIGAPYYSLLRATEKTGSDRIRAFVERSPRIWIEAGFAHPFAERISPAPGQHLLVQADCEWRTLKEQPFQDIYSVLDFQLPAKPQPLADADARTRLQVPVRLSRSSGDDTGEIFVLTRDAIRQLDQFVQASSDAVLERLAFAVAQHTDSDEPTVVIRIRPGRTLPPVLVFDCLTCRNYLKIPNLFVPVGKRIHPPLRRDAVRDLLADDQTKLVWLAPADSQLEDSSETTEQFVARSIPDSSFLPLTDWVDYVLDRDQEKLTAWRQSHQFEFEDFICRDEQTKASKKDVPKKATAKSGRQEIKAAESDDSDPPKRSTVDKLISRFRRTAKAPPEDAEIAQLKANLASVEKTFLEMESPLEDPDRLPLWNDMADLNSSLERFTDSSICRQHQLWDAESPDEDILRLWFETDMEAAVRLGSTPLRNQDDQVTLLELRRIIKASSSSPADASQLASWVAWAAQDNDSKELVRTQLANIQQFLEKSEAGLAVRTCWMAWLALARTNDDVLTLARARDRILERMYLHGLTVDRDLPSFLRMGGSQSGERFRQIREKVKDLHETVRGWSVANLGLSSPHTKHYIDLIFAFAFARLGETSAAIDLVHNAEKDLLHKPDPVHQWLFDAYSYRIQSVVSGQGSQGSFPDALLNRLDSAERLDRYKIDRLRQHSSILEPMEKLDPYREWRRRDEKDLQKQLADLFVENDREALAEKLQELLSRKLAIDEKAQVLTTALELSTRLGETFAAGLLSEVVQMDTRLSDPIVRAELLEKGLQIGAHYDHTSAVQECFSRMTQLLESQKNADVSTLEALEKLLSRSFLTLRKLGMRDEIAFLLEAMTKVVRDSRQDKGIETERLRVLLQLAGGWFYFGQDRGWKDIDVARELLLSKSLVKEGHVGAKKQTDLAVSYICAVGQAPLHDAVQRLDDLFRHLTGVRDGQTVSSHYSLKQLDIVESLVQTIVSDSFTMDKNSQRWMDDEEFLIRRRIHRDMRKMMD